VASWPSESTEREVASSTPLLAAPSTPRPSEIGRGDGQGGEEGRGKSEAEGVGEAHGRDGSPDGEDEGGEQDEVGGGV
jgi:hypothetical protein